MDLIVHETWLHQGSSGGTLHTLKLDGEFSVDILVVLSQWYYLSGILVPEAAV